MMRMIMYSMNTNLPVPGLVEPLGLRDIKRIKKEKDPEMEIEYENEDGGPLKGIQVTKVTKAVLANPEMRLEISDNEVIIPLSSKSK